ncbi:C40 family peptidase [Streptomyces sp. H27-D2]|uniref:C40 family peptidase n=1 Tax=Streptomyces sp. H27-D2 TaxID=3046304 RepID=UPI002DBEE7C1|nr:NlpC/P60 family protein [Streptomyces sp. H27-D2]MEC4015996.1 NlpC/P60 family protein [Streptomyces sp. H27-D2]
MASHRKPKQRSFSGHTVRTARTAATLAIAGAATATAFSGTGQAEPRLSTAQVKSKVDRLYREAEEATERYNGVKERADEARDSVDALRDEAARRTGRLNAARNALGSYASGQYRSGGVSPAMRLALSSSPERYLERAAITERAGRGQAATVASVSQRLRDVRQVRERADGKLAELKRSQATLRTHKRTIERKLDTAEKLLAKLTEAQRASLAARDGDAGPGGARAGRSALRGPVAAPTSGRAALAVSFARSALGKPYVWGATGPDAFDCSGLTQAAWRAAGVSLPRTTYTQINAGSSVPKSQLAPGDLVFFYSGVSHVGLYVGNGQMIHAPRPGSPVRIAPIDQMPFAGASRPA